MLMKLTTTDHGKYELPDSFADEDGCVIYPINLLCKMLKYNNKIDENLHLLYEVKSNDMKRKQIDDIISKSLNQREQQILYFRYHDKATYKEIGELFNLSTERTREIEAKAMRKLRHPSLSKFKKHQNEYFNIESTKQAHGITDAVCEEFFDMKKLKEIKRKREEKEQRERQKKLEEERERIYQQKQEELLFLRMCTCDFDDYLIEEFPNGITDEYVIRKMIYNKVYNKKYHVFNHINEYPELFDEIKNFCNLKTIDQDKINSLLNQMFVMYEQTKNTDNVKCLYEEYKRVFLRYCAFMYDTFLHTIERYDESNAHIKLERDGVMYFYPERNSIQ